MNSTSTLTTKGTRHWWMAIASFLMVLLTMPLGHALMIMMEQFLEESALHYCGFALGAVGMALVVIGVYAKGDTQQTLWGFFGGLLFWTGWVEFLFKYYAERYGTQPQLDPITQDVITKPEYLILPASFGFWMMIMTVYIFCTQTGCNYINWWQKVLFGKTKRVIVARSMTRHVSIITFMELTMILWTSYLLLMFCYDDRFIGDHSIVTLLVGVGCFIGSIFIFLKQTKIGNWGANIRMAIPAVIVFWTPVEILGRIKILQEIWIHPLQHKTEMGAILLCFVLLALYLWYAGSKKKKQHP